MKTIFPFCLLLAFGCRDRDDHQRSLREIEELHRRDEKASQAKDYNVLRSLMSDSAIIMPPGAPFLKVPPKFTGENGNKNEQIIDYKIKMNEVIVLGEYAVEYGTISGTTLRGDQLHSESHKVMRVLRLEGNEWKIYRSIWNDLIANGERNESNRYKNN